MINGASETGELNSSEFDVTFDNLCANGNIAVYDHQFQPCDREVVGE